uniref:Uncharacterized protein n=1 Tax=Solanum tuberosum TaxID=4113 RepID=M1DKR5_SOLTU
MRDKALNEMAGFSFPCLIGKLCRQANIPPNRLVDKWGEASRLTQVSKIENVANHLFGAKSGAALGTYVTIPMIFLDKLVTDQRQTRTLVDQIVNRMPQLIEKDVLTAKKEITDEMRKELVFLKDGMDGLENLVHDQFQVAGLVDIEEFKAQLVEIRT